METIATITLRDFLRTYPDLYDTEATYHLLGAPGSAKSSGIRTLPQIMSKHLGRPFGFFEVLVPTIDAADVRGFCIPTKDKEGRPVARFAYPPIFPSFEYLAEHPEGILFLDEFNSGDQLTCKAFGPVILDLMSGEYALPPGWRIMMASNRMNDRSGTNAPFMHLINRECRLEVDLSVEYWVLDFADPAGIHPLGIAYAKARPGVFAREVPPERKPFCTFRSFTSAMRKVAAFAGKDERGRPNMNIPVTGITQAFVAGDVGDGTAADMFAFFKVVNELPTMDEILRAPEMAKVPDDSRLDASFAALQMCVHNCNIKNADTLWTYIERLPLELQTSAAKSLLEKAGGQFLNSKKFGAWIARHRALVMASTGK